MTIKEEWRDVPEYPELFMVSTHGRVWSKRSNKILKPTKLQSGYLVICTKIGGRKGKNITRRIHRWAAEAFLDNPHNKPQVNHIDGIKTNNYLSNLEWSSASENICHAHETGLIVPKRGEELSYSKLTESQIREIRNRYVPRCRKNGVRAMSREFGVHHSTIQYLLNDGWSHVN